MIYEENVARAARIGKKSQGLAKEVVPPETIAAVKRLIEEGEIDQALTKLEREVDALLAKKKTPASVKIAAVERAGSSLVLPDGWSYNDGINQLMRMREEEETTIAVYEEFDAFPWDGANALRLALDEKFGFFRMVGTPSFFGKIPPEMMTINISATETTQIPWGRLEIQQLSGYLETGAEKGNDGRYHFTLGGQIKKKFEVVFKEIGQLVRKHLHESSIYRGKPVRIRFKGDSGKPLPMPTPVFLDLSGVRPNELIFTEEIDAAIADSLFTPLERSQECRDNGIPLKRGVLLAGTFGVGKTLAAYVSAKKAEENGWSFIYCERADELSDAIRFALQYQPAAVFCEDVDRDIQGDRDVSMDHLLNVIDGIDAKNTELMTVLTTNEVENINQAMLRPGRLDAVVHIKAPDADAVKRLIRLYGRGLVPADDPLDKAGYALEGQIPAVIRECVERAKLSALRLSSPGDPLRLTDEAISRAAATMKMHLMLLAPKETDTRSDLEKAADRLGTHIRQVETTEDGRLERVPSGR